MYGRVHTSLDIIICSHAIDTIKNNDMFMCVLIMMMWCVDMFTKYLFYNTFYLDCRLFYIVGLLHLLCIPARLIICFWMYHPCCLEGEDLDRAMRDGVFQ